MLCTQGWEAFLCRPGDAACALAGEPAAGGRCLRVPGTTYTALVALPSFQPHFPFSVSYVSSWGSWPDRGRLPSGCPCEPQRGSLGGSGHVFFAACPVPGTSRGSPACRSPSPGAASSLQRGVVKVQTTAACRPRAPRTWEAPARQTLGMALGLGPDTPSIHHGSRLELLGPGFCREVAKAQGRDGSAASCMSVRVWRGRAALCQSPLHLSPGELLSCSVMAPRLSALIQRSSCHALGAISAMQSLPQPSLSFPIMGAAAAASRLPPARNSARPLHVWPFSQLGRACGKGRPCWAGP